MRKLKTLPGREILLYGIGFGKKEQSERERENAADQMMALSANHNLHLTQVEPQQLVKVHFFLLSFFTLQDDICKCRDFQPMILKEYFD